MRGEMDEPDEDVEAAAMEEARLILEDAGFHRYEVASYARPGFESRHNTAYWTGKPYLGLGRSAVTMTQNAERRMRVQDGQVVDDLDARQMAAEGLHAWHAHGPRRLRRTGGAGRSGHRRRREHGRIFGVDDPRI